MEHEEAQKKSDNVIALKRFTKKFYFAKYFFKLTEFKALQKSSEISKYFWN